MNRTLIRCALFLYALVSTCGSVLAQAVPGEVVFSTDFEGAAGLRGWQGIQPDKTRLDAGYQSEAAVFMTATPVEPNTKIQIPLALEKMRGNRLRFQALVKAEGVVKPARAHHGIKLMLHFQSASLGEQWLQQDDVHGTFDWKTVAFVASVPPDATHAELIVGLEATSGRVWFDAIKVSVISATRQRPVTPPTGEVYRGHTLPRLRGVMVHPNIDEAGLRTLGRWKVNLVRWQLLWNSFPNSPADKGDLVAYDAWLESALVKLDAALPLCRELGIKVVVDLHTPPGGLDKNNQWRLFQEKRYQDSFVALWDKIARRYLGNQTIWGYDLVNEPRQNLATIPTDKGVLDWHALATLVATRVRAIEADRTIIVAGENGGDIRGLQDFEPLPVPGIVYTVHFYEPHEFTHQGIGVGHPPLGTQYPGLIRGQTYDKERLRRAMESTRQWQKDYNAHIYIGEFSAIRWAAGADKWLQDSIELFEEYGWDWSYHAFREYSGWSVEHSDNKADTAPAPTPTTREKVLRSWFDNNQTAGEVAGAR